ncbi:MAG: putative prohead protease [Prokaryotic dsDNA virus sp.]|jgi:HK97 family phage prohead protease|nr:MAG: putative prohead protease [Prokaryotic dsDNA virus sp.]QDP59776.1 MAG: putative prohead protease [Prokaryotic dsDNA virus sp.]|tara:strand:- start:10077 stop:10895 length:819 start_codon:yes stop_codon:yes gene_type:complete
MKNKEWKSITDPIFTDEVEGKVEAVFSVFNTVDSDGDVVLPKSIKSGYGDKGVAMVWGHDWKDVIGRGEIVQDNDKAVFKGQFIMDTERGREAYNTVKAMGDLQQWSFGYEVLDSENGVFKKDGEAEVDVRYLKNLKVWEVSPVLVGANQETYTLAVKEDKEEEKEIKLQQTDKKGKRFTDEIAEVLNALVSVTNRAKELTALRLQKNKMLSKESTEALSTLADEIQEVYNDIDEMLTQASVEVEVEENVEAYDTLKRTQEILTESVEVTER